MTVLVISVLPVFACYYQLETYWSNTNLLGSGACVANRVTTLPLGYSIHGTFADLIGTGRRAGFELEPVFSRRQQELHESYLQLLSLHPCGPGDLLTIRCIQQRGNGAEMGRDGG